MYISQYLTQDKCESGWIQIQINGLHPSAINVNNNK